MGSDEEALAPRRSTSVSRRCGILGAEEAANLIEVANILGEGTCLGNWLTREQANELLAAPDRSTIRGKRDYAILALLVGCALRHQELANLDVQKKANKAGCGHVPQLDQARLLR